MRQGSTKNSSVIPFEMFRESAYIFVCVWIWDKKSEIHFFTHFSVGEKRTISLYIGFLSTCFCDRSFFCRQKLMWVTDIFSVRETFFVTEVCFFNRKYKKKRTISLYIGFLSTCFCDRSFFCRQKLMWVTDIFSVRETFFVTEVCFFNRNSDKNCFLWWKLVF